jgi:hypothetical protein
VEAPVVAMQQKLVSETSILQGKWRNEFFVSLPHSKTNPGLCHLSKLLEVKKPL